MEIMICNCSMNLSYLVCNFKFIYTNGKKYKYHRTLKLKQGTFLKTKSKPPQKNPRQGHKSRLRR